MNLEKNKILIQKLSYLLPFSLSIFCGILFGWFISSIYLRSSISLLNEYRPSLPTRLYDRNGHVFAELYKHKQELVSFKSIPQHVIDAFFAVEDTNFYNHFGIDLPGILRAAVVNILSGKIVQGGSTITQQLAKQIYLNAEGRRERSFIQKIRETILALQIEEELSKNEILEVFFNVIYLGHGCKGIVCASYLYFNKKVSSLTIAEGALLARLPRSPIFYSPFKNPHQAKKVHLYVLKRMAEASYLDPKKIQSIHNKFWLQYWSKIIVRSPSKNTWNERLNQAPFFTEYVRQVLEANPNIGKEVLYSNSLDIFTTLDINHQKIAKKTIDDMRLKISKSARSHALTKGVAGVDFSLFNWMQSLRMLLPIPKLIITELTEKQKLQREIEETLLDATQFLFYVSPTDNEASAIDHFRQETASNYVQLQLEQAFVSIQPQTGYITSMVGGSHFSPKNQFNRVLQARRQPGSAFKIFVYGSALEQRLISSKTPINDAPFLRAASDGTSWTPENYEPGFRGLVRAERALASSLNTCAVELYYKVKAPPIIEFAGRLMKIANPEQRFKEEPALALGSSEITPMELTRGMAVIANRGREVIPFGIRYVVDRNREVIYSLEDEVRQTIALKTRENTIQVIEPSLAYIMQKMLKYVSDRGTPNYGIRAYSEGNFQGEIASKTGTTSNYSDAWITGFNPEYVATVWFGFDKSSITMGPGSSGGGLAAPVLGKFFREIYKDRKYPTFSSSKDWQIKPENVITSPCKGLALGEKVINGKKLSLKERGPCRGVRIKDVRKVLMQEMGITPEDLGEKDAKSVRFQ